MSFILNPLLLQNLTAVNRAATREQQLVAYCCVSHDLAPLQAVNTILTTNFKAVNFVLAKIKHLKL